MQLRQAAVIFLTSTVVLTQLSGCAAVAPDKGVENSDDVTVVTEETNANSTAANTDTVTVGGEQYDVSETPAEQVEQEEIPLTTEELHALFKKEYEFYKWAKANLYDDQYQTYYLKLPAREIGTQTDANVYADIEAEVAKPEYEGKILPDDGFEQYVAWREALEKGSSSGNNQSGNNSGNTGNKGNTGNTGGQTQQKPSTKPSGGSNNSSGGSSNNGGSSGGSQGGTSQNGDPTANIRNGSGATDVPEGGFDEKEYEKPSYEIIG